MAILLLFYKLVLEQENMHVFKRYFLLSAILVSFIIPAIVFVEYIEPVSASVIPTTNPKTITPYQILEVPTDVEVINWSKLFWTIYVVGLLGFGFRFVKHLYQILRRIRVNPKLKTQFSIKVLLKEKLPPHTFFSYIFLNKNKFESNAIPKAVLIHEEIHAQQYHSLDVLLIELLQVIFWFNPLVYLFKKSIKLNHEFLADSAVLDNGLEKSDYQKLLLAFSSTASEPQLVNALTYSSIKKRFKVMKKRTSKNSIVFRSFLVLPLVALLLFGFSERKLIENQITNPIAQETAFILEPIEIRIDGEGRLFLKDKKISNLQKLEEGLLNFNQNLSKEQREQKVNAVIKVAANTPKKLIKDVDRILMEYGVAQLNIHGPEPAYTGILVETVTEQSQTEKYNSLAEKYNAIPIEKRVIPLQDLKVLETIYHKMNTTERNKAQPFPECLPNTKQDGATRQQMKEYNELAKTYNKMLEKRGNIRILKSDVERLEYLYSRMSKKQRDDAEPFPDFPEPPPAPKAPKGLNEREEAAHTIEEIIETQDPYDVVNSGIRIDSKDKKIVFPENSKVYIYNSGKSTNSSSGLINYVTSNDLKDAQFYFEGKQISSKEGLEIIKNRKDIKVETIPHTNKQPEVRIYKSESEGTIPSPPHPPRAPKGSKEAITAIPPLPSPVVLKGTASSIPEPPLPPKPVTPLDHVIAMAKKDARFLYEGKEISSDTAIELMKKNKALNIDSRAAKGKRPVVNLSKSPFE